MKFTTKIVIAGTLISFSTLLLLSVIQYRAVNQNVQHSITTQIDQTLKQSTELLNTHLESNYAFSLYVTEQVARNRKEDMQQLFEPNSVSSMFVTAGVGFANDGAITHNDNSWVPPASWDSRTRPWYQNAIQTKKRAISEPYVDEGTGQVLISISYPVYQNNRILGASFFDVELSALSQELNQAIEDHATLFIVHKNGTIISHPVSSNNGQHVSTLIGNNPISDQVVVTSIFGKKNYLDFSQVPGEDWLVGLALDYDVSHQVIYDIRNYSAIITFFAFILVGFLFSIILHLMTKPLRDVSVAMQNIGQGDGDLTKRLPAYKDEEFKLLAESFNHFTSRIQTLVSGSQTTSETVSKVSNDAKLAFRDSSQMLEQQVKELEQLATAMNEMTTTSYLVAQNAQEAASSTQTADEATSEGVLLVTQTTQSIEQLANEVTNAAQIVSELEGATDSIETIVQVINGIAEQTNLLALNAAIEAARAGDSGRGFAVVADEVRTLAQRTQESTNEIRQMVDKLQLGASTASKAMTNSHTMALQTLNQAKQANDVFQDIKQSVSLITDVNLQIASAAEEQNIVAEEINVNTVTIRDLSEKISTYNANTAKLIDEQNTLVLQQSLTLKQFIV